MKQEFLDKANRLKAIELDLGSKLRHLQRTIDFFEKELNHARTIEYNGLLYIDNEDEIDLFIHFYQGIPITQETIDFLKKQLLVIEEKIKLTKEKFEAL